MKKILIALFLFCFVMGCASKNDSWYLNGKTQSQFDRDCEICNNQACSGNDNAYHESGEMIGSGAASGNGALAGVGALNAVEI